MSARLILIHVAVATSFHPTLGDIGHVCRGTNPSEGGCQVDGKNCEGDLVNFSYYGMNLSSWNDSAKTNNLIGTVPSYAITGQNDTWQMYLHGPLLRPTERTSATSIPPLFTHATWTNKIYRFEFLSDPKSGDDLQAKQKLVGWADAPSTSWPVEDSNGSLKSLMVAEGQPFWLSIYGGFKVPMEIGKGGVNILPNEPEAKCSKIFPTNFFHKMFGQVVNTVDCHRRLGVCFFTVWKFYDDQNPIWNPISKLIAPDCLYYCMAENLDGNPSCAKVDVVRDENGTEICHQHGVGAVHGMTIGHDVPDSATDFEIFLIFTGQATFNKGESSMKKLKVQVTGDGQKASQKDFKVLHSAEFGTQLFKDLPAAGLDAGGDHAWVDDTGKWVWVSTFRTGAPGVHMLDYYSGALMYSITGLDSYIPHQYLYSAGIHGTGTIGKKGSYIAVATSACSIVSACAPIPWIEPTKKYPGWAAAVQFVIDISSIAPPELDAKLYAQLYV